MNWENKKVVVAGAGGFIGSQLVEALLERGAKVTAIVRYNSQGSIGNLALIDEGARGLLEITRAELCDLADLRSVLGGKEVIFNLAAYVGIPYSFVNPQEVIENNVLSTLNLLLIAKENGIEKFIQTSTSEVYGSARTIPIPENYPYQPQSPYSASKIASDNIALSFYYSYGLPVTIVRPFNTYGPRQSARAIIPTLITQALTEEIIKVGSTTTTRDFTYVADTVRGFIQTAEAGKTDGQVFNLGTGREIAVHDLAAMIIVMVGRKVKIENDPSRIRPEKSEVQRLCSDISKVKSIVGWSPSVTLEEGLGLTLEWIRKNIDSYKPNEYNI